MLIRVATMLAFVIASLLFISPVYAAPNSQTDQPDLEITAETTISITVILTTGQTIVVPVDIGFTAHNQKSGPVVSIDAEVGPQAGYLIGVETSSTISTSVQLLEDGTRIATGTPTPSASSTSIPQDGEVGSYIATRNANLRSGPGTNFGIVGSVRAGDVLMVVGRNADGTWLQLENGAWIYASLVEASNEITPVPTITVQVPPTQPPATATPVATLPATPTATPTTELILQSQGLGTTFEEWKAEYGEPTEDLGGGFYVFDTRKGFYFVITFSGRLTQIHREWEIGNSPSFADAKLVAQSLMPSDAVFRSSYVAYTGSYVEVYFSQQLANLYPDGLYDEIIGEFIAIYQEDEEDGKVAGLILGTGNNP